MRSKTPRRLWRDDPERWGKVIVIDGINGSGKSTVAKLLWRKIFELDFDHVVELHCDPGGTDVGEKIRKLVKDPGVEMSPMTQFLMYSAARAELAKEIAEKVREGIHVVLDRWWPSTFAYQGANGIPFELIGTVNRAILPAPVAMDRCRTFILDRPLAVSLKFSQKPTTKRKGDYEMGRDRFELEGLSFLSHVVDRYHALREMHMASLVPVAEIGSAEDVADHIWDDIKHMFPTGKRGKKCRSRRKSPTRLSKQPSKRSRTRTSTPKGSST